MNDARIHALDALLRHRLTAPLGRRFGLAFATFLLSLLAGSMILVRLVDGPRAFLDGIAGRAVSVFVVLVAIPFAFAVAAQGRAFPMDPGVLALTRLRGFDEETVVARLARSVAQVAAMRSLFASGAVCVLLLLLSLPDGHALRTRALVAILLVSLSTATTVGLAMLGFAAARYGGRWGRSLLFAAMLVPVVIVALVPALPESANGFGTYEAALDGILSLAPRLARGLLGSVVDVPGVLVEGRVRAVRIRTRPEGR